MAFGAPLLRNLPTVGRIALVRPASTDERQQGYRQYEGHGANVDKHPHCASLILSSTVTTPGTDQAARSIATKQ
jgi:hypothetical protein